MPLEAYESPYCSDNDVEALLSEEGVNLRLDDNQDGAVNAAELLRLTRQACNYATSKVNDFCAGRYDPADLETSWTVNEWATVIAARWLCSRRGNPVPGSLKERLAEVMDELKQVKSGQYSLQDLAERTSSAPIWSNTRVDVRYRTRRIRVERPISEGTPPRVAPNVDREADLTVEY